MTTFVYKAKKNSAETVTGQISAQSEDEAIDLINQLGLLPVSVEPREFDPRALDPGKPQKVKSRDLFIFSRQLSNLLKSGVSLLRALVILEGQIDQPYFKKVVSKIIVDIKNGMAFSECLGQYPHIFSPLYITMVNAGEESGQLQPMLVSVANYQKKQVEIHSKVRNALAYPILMGIVGFLTIFYILTFVLPKMATLFENLGDQLPFITVVMLAVSDFLRQTGWWLILVVLAVFAVMQRMGYFQKFRKSTARTMIHMPLFGEIILKTELSRFCRTLVLLLNSGIAVTRALKISIPMLSNDVIKDHLDKCAEDLTSGGSFGESIKECPELPSMMGHLISVGEESGNLNDVLTEIADTYEQETDEKIKVLTTLFEPAMILGVGLIVAFIVFAMLLPIFQVDVLAG